MSAEDRYQAALDACVGFLKLDSYDESSKKFTAAQKVQKLDYDSSFLQRVATNIHPTCWLTEVPRHLKIGISITINNPADSTFFGMLDAMRQEICSCLGRNNRPDMYQVYHSSNIVGKGGTNSNHYAIDSSDLDNYIMNARKSPIRLTESLSTSRLLT